MKVLGAGLSNTGTFSLKIALDILGFPCYNFGDVLINHDKGHTEMWNNYMEGISDMDWHQLFAGYEAVVDSPTYLYIPEMMEVFPDLRVILTLRDTEKWYASLEGSIKQHKANVTPVKFLPSFNQLDRAFDNILDIALNGDFSKESKIAWYHRHNAEVKRIVPEDRLLIYKVTEGWEPLCAFLGVPEPDEPFPWANKGFEDAVKLLQDFLKRDLKKMIARCSQLLETLE